MKIYCSVFVTKVGDPRKNAREMIEIMRENAADVYLFPAYCLTGVSCSDLMTFQCFADEVNEALDTLCEYSENAHACIATAVAGYENIIIRDGELIQKGGATVCGKKIAVAQTGDDKGSDILLLPTAMNGYPCIQNDIIEFCADNSRTRKCVIAVANQGFGESSADNVYKGFAGVFNRGVIVDFKSQEAPERIAASAEDTQQTGLIYTRPNRGSDRVPYYGKNDPERYLNELFLLQTQALYTRLEGRQKRAVALRLTDTAGAAAALLCAESALKMCGADASGIYALCADANSDAAALARAVGATVLPCAKDELDATADVLRAASAHDAVSVAAHDLTDCARGLLFGGEAVREYALNASVPKTLLRALIQSPKRQTEQTKPLLCRIAEQTENTEPEDFMLFFFARRKNSYSDIKNLCLATLEELDEDEIVRRLDAFYDAYRSARQSRAAVFEGASVIGFKLPYFPADADYRLI